MTVDGREAGALVRGGVGLTSFSLNSGGYGRQSFYGGGMSKVLHTLYSTSMGRAFHTLKIIVTLFYTSVNGPNKVLHPQAI